MHLGASPRAKSPIPILGFPIATQFRAGARVIIGIVFAIVGFALLAERHS